MEILLVCNPFGSSVSCLVGKKFKYVLTEISKISSIGEMSRR
uniref:Uncharacterized protein n=1 Tax=Nelumbo nucifera TaxID=4432 RepID=A0A822YY00_NELNU|nr:TPA_asm: hypothetical protein HUJ06_008021 [Nelumbo nucifera]